MDMKVNATPNLLNSFLLVYFYELEKQLNASDNKLQVVKFQSEEANTDEFLKKYFKKYIKKNNNIKASNLKQHKRYTFSMIPVIIPKWRPQAYSIRNCQNFSSQ